MELRTSCSHTQHDLFGWLLLMVALITFWLGMVAPQSWVEQAIRIGLGCLFVILAGSMCSLTVRDVAEALAVRYGPLPMFRRRFH
jgi:prepilin signal peptidase PulO-like enzyme (type II secretory pathway)